MSKLISQKQHFRPMIKAQYLLIYMLTCMILSDTECNKFWSSEKGNPKGYNLLSCRILNTGHFVSDAAILS